MTSKIAMLCEYSETHCKQEELRNKQPLALVLAWMPGQHQLQAKHEMYHSGGTTFRLRFAPKQKRGMRNE